MMRACRTCHRITGEEVCPTCKINTSQYWSGYLGIINPEKSEIAKKLKDGWHTEITPGQYALKVR